MTRSREWLLLNAVESWLHHYERVGNYETVQLYKQLQEEFHSAYMATIVKDVETEPPRTPRKRTNAKSSTKTV